MPRDYYVVLGIPSSANAEEIHAAFRRRSKELHPDVSGEDSGPFVELQEAYAVLSDPARRRNYDRESTVRVHVRGSRRAPRESAVPLRGRGVDVVLRPRPTAEPLSPPRTASLIDDFQSFHPSFEELFHRLWTNFSGLARPKGERVESLNVEIVVNTEEARRDGRVRIDVPTRVGCPTCHGYGAVGGFVCWRCGGDGAMITQQAVHVDCPAGLRDGYTVRVPLSGFGISNYYLTAVFRVSAKEAGEI